MKRETRSLKVNPDVWKEAKKFCVENDMQISNFIEGLILDKLGRKNQKKRKEKVWGDIENL